MSKPLTMTEAQEVDLRDKASRLHDWPTFGLATQRVVMSVLAEVDAIRAALAAANGKIEHIRREWQADADRMNAALAAAEAKLADERRHADAMYGGLVGDSVERTRMTVMHRARRNAEKGDAR